MLILSRLTGQEIVITVAGHTIRVVLVESGRDRARIGVDAPPQVTIDRLEVHRAKQAGGRGEAK